MENWQLLITCEHASNTVPAKWRGLFKNQIDQLESHRGWDIGVQPVYEALCKSVNCYQKAGEFTRLLVDLNRSPESSQLFSSTTSNLKDDEKKEIIDTFYQPYRSEVEQQVIDALQKGKKVLHISVHSFTPYLNKSERRTDLGILFDPMRRQEKIFARIWRSIFTARSKYKARFNYPYRGVEDALTTWLREKYGENYLGLELEVNQKLYFAGGPEWDKMLQDLVISFEMAVTDFCNDESDGTSWIRKIEEASESE